MTGPPGRDTPLIVAIDGPAGAGKSTVARMVADRLGVPYIDSGSMYRSIALLALRRKVAFDDAAGLSRLAERTVIEWKGPPGQQQIHADGEPLGDELRTPEVSQAASQVSAVPGVRAALLERQRLLGRTLGCVMEGRDIGTVIFPEARVKVYLTAGQEERMRRRAADLRDMGRLVDLDDVRKQLEERDRRDAERDISPMKPASDAVVLATDGLSPEEVAARIIALSGRRAQP